MPYDGQLAGKGGHADFVKNPDVQRFLRNCEYMREPSDNEAVAMSSSFGTAPTFNGTKLPSHVLASDASKNDTSIGEKFPSTQFGFIKVSHVLIHMSQYKELIDPANRFVDPFKVAELHKNANPVTFVMPSSNIRYGGSNTVRSGFRKAVFEQLSIDRSEGSGGKSLTDALISLWGGSVETAGCKECAHPHPFQFTDAQRQIGCPACGAVNYVTDILRLDENISDFGDNSTASTRMMNAVEHLFLGAFIMEILEKSPQTLSNIAFVMDGPLAIFGEPAKLHSRLMAMIHGVNQQLTTLRMDPILIIGLQKTGTVMEHAQSLNKHLKNGAFRLIDDEYRNRYISSTEASNFGNETYYGQDFLFKTEGGRIFNFAVPYPFANKGVGAGGATQFSASKSDVLHYGEILGRACDLIRHFEMDLYESSIVPVALAHRHASISLVPGGKVLDILAKTAMQRAP